MLHSRYRIAVLASALSAAFSSSFAQSSADSDLQLARLDPVVVTGSRYWEPGTAASAVVDVIGREEIEASGASNVTEFLGQVPGVSVNRLYGRMGVDASVDVGFLGEAGSQNVLILIDGQRLNSFDGAGVRFTQLPISSIEQIEVRKASGGVLYGDRAQGGVINIITRQDRAREVNVAVGSFGYKKIDTYLGFGSSEVVGSVSAMSARSDGYRVFSGAEQLSGRASLSVLSSVGRLTVAARSYEEDAELPSYLTESQFKADPRQRGAFPIRTERRGSGISARWEGNHVRSGGSGLILDLSQHETVDRTYDSIRNTRMTFTPEYIWSWGNTRLIAGLELYEAKANTDDKKQVAQRGDAAFAQISQQINPRVALDVGLRSQRVSNDFQAEPGASTSSSDDRRQAVSAGVRWAITERTQVRAGVLSGYRFANADELYFYQNEFPYTLLAINSGIRPMRSREVYVEAAQRYSLGRAGVHFRRIGTRDEIGYQYDCGLIDGKNASCNANLYDTRRELISLFGDLRLPGHARLRVALDLVDATIDSGVNSGQRVPLTPERVFRISAERTVGSMLWALVGHSRDGMPQAADPSNRRSYIPSRFIADLGVTATLNPQLTGAVWIRNLADKSYYDYASWNGLYPADGRSVEASLRLMF
jgi:iron complex outermembrane receptor protein